MAPEERFIITILRFCLQDSGAEASSRNEQKRWKDVDVYIYSIQQSSITKAREKIHRHMKDVFVSRTEANPLIVNFSSEQVFVLIAFSSMTHHY